MLLLSSSLLALATTALAAKTSRTFAVNYFYGTGPLLTCRADPIVSPGVPAGHTHMIMGGSNFNLSMSDTILESSTCTNSLAKADKSNYWVPQLYFRHSNGTLESVPLFYMKVYYFFEATDDDIKAFEPGHRMVVGDVTLRTPPWTASNVLDTAQGVPQPVQFTCPRSDTSTPLYPPDSDGLHGVGIQDPTNSGAGVGFPDKSCDGYASPLRADIHFPSCYNPAAGLDAYKTNMVFPSSKGVKTPGGANCPPGWTHTPHLFFEVYWNTLLFSPLWTPGQGNQPFVLANGDVTGYSLHADFISGWDQGALQQIIENCDSGNNGMDKCPGLEGGVNDASTSCTITCPVHEQVTGLLNQLPGNNPLTGWGLGGAVAPPPTASTSPATTSSKAAATTSSVSKAAVTNVVSASASQATTTKVVSSVCKAGTTSLTTQITQTFVGTTSVSSSKPVVTSSVAKPVTSSTITTSSAAPAVTTTKAAVTTSASLPSTSGAPSHSGYESVGCYSDPLNPRALTGITFAYLGAGVKITSTGCVDYCSKNGYSIAGTEYANQCFCGNTFNAGSKPIAASSCNMACEGDSTQTCGGPGALSVWQKSGSVNAVKPASSAAPPASSAPASSSVTTISGFASSGCYSDPLTPRALTGITFAYLGAGVKITTSGCIQYCDKNGYTMAGTEYAGQCFCGNSLNTPSTKIDDSKCNMACEGDASETCGGSAALSVWHKQAAGKRSRRSNHHGRVKY